MYITIKSINKTLGKYIEFTDLYIGLPSFIFFLILFSIPHTRLFSLVILSTIVFLLLPINLSKKNRMYKIVIMVLKYFFKCKNYIYIK